MEGVSFKFGFPLHGGYSYFFSHQTQDSYSIYFKLCAHEKLTYMQSYR